MPLFDSILNLFRKKTKEVITETPKEIPEIPMAETLLNSITLSPDLNTIFLIDNGRAIPFDLNHKNGIVIGMLEGQVTVATGLPVIIPPVKEDPIDFEDPEVPDLPDDGSGSATEKSDIERLASRPRYLRIPLIRRQFTLMIHKKLGALSIIGASDIDVSIIGASDIDVSIIGASDIDVSLTRSIDPEPEATATPTEASTESTRPRCLIYSFQINKKSINIKRAGDTLIVQYWES